MKYAYVFHGWSGSPDEPMLKWIAEKLIEKGYVVSAPQMPNPDTPVIETWLEKASQEAQELNEETVLIGHSVGCQTILRFMETLPEDVKVGKIILVAPWLTLQNLDSEEEWSVAKPWLESPLHPEKILTHTNTITAILSTNDPFVPLEENKKFCEDLFGAKVIVLENRGHFTESDNVSSLPEILDML